MSLPPSPGRILLDPAILSAKGSTLLVRAAGVQPGQESGQGMDAPPPGEARVESLFEFVGIALSLAIVVAAVWILFRRRR